MVRVYMAGHSATDAAAANAAAIDFSDFLRGYIETRRTAPADDLITHLIAATRDGERLSTDELITTCILLLNAGHEATVHTLGNGIKTMLDTGTRPADDLGPLVEEIMRVDPPLHIFSRYAREDVTLFGHDFKTGDLVNCALASGNRDPAIWDNAETFDPTRKPLANNSFGGGLHFCVGAPLARLELQIAIKVLFDRCPNLALSGSVSYGDVYHFHGLETLIVTR
jgi:cytochrome P450